MPKSDCYQEAWDFLTWIERGRFMVNHCESIPSSEYSLLSKLEWKDIPQLYQEKLAFEMFVVGTVFMAMNQ